jgi:uncharacterized protein YjiS (DUF1127 family)
MLHCKIDRSQSVRQPSSSGCASGTAREREPIPPSTTRRIGMTTYNAKTHPAFAGYGDIANSDGALSTVRRLFAKLADWSAKNRAYHATVSELYALSDRDLADIGISRSDIPAVARDAARVARNSR